MTPQDDARRAAEKVAQAIRYADGYILTPFAVGLIEAEYRNLLATPAAQPAPAEGMKHYPYRASARDWTEDYTHENGQYLNRCHFCGAPFCGHKRRVSCRVCTPPAPSQGERAGLSAEEREDLEFIKHHLALGDITEAKKDIEYLLAIIDRLAPTSET